jgi:hypothetical protein
LFSRLLPGVLVSGASTGREWYAPQDKTSEYHQFVSTYNGKVLGEMGYHKCVPARKADGLYCCHFTKDNGYIFMKDLLPCVQDV